MEKKDALALNIDDELKKELQAKMADRNKDLLLDKLEEREVLLSKVRELNREIEELSGRAIIK